jgi:hypothetical protein
MDECGLFCTAISMAPEATRSMRYSSEGGKDGQEEYWIVGLVEAMMRQLTDPEQSLERMYIMLNNM